jgi:tetratricopeptide (TPR) repeat protein
VYEGLLYRYVRADETYNANVDWPAYHDLPERPTPFVGDWSEELIEHEYRSALGRRQLQSGDVESGTDSLIRAAALVHGDKSALNNIGLAFDEHGLLAQATEQFARALDSDPHFIPALLNLARCHIESGEASLALPLLDRALTAGADPDSVSQMKRAASDSLEGEERRATEY